MPRTDMDFSKHKLSIAISETLAIHDLAIPDTILHRIRFINTCGHLIVDGDYGTWIFCREFRPSIGGSVSTSYWCEKLEADSTQSAMIYDSDVAVKEVKELAAKEKEYGCNIEDVFSWLDDLEAAASGSEYEYIATVMDYPDGIETEDIPDGRIVNPRLQIIFDAFEEICRRLAL